MLGARPPARPDPRATQLLVRVRVGVTVSVRVRVVRVRVGVRVSVGVWASPTPNPNPNQVRAFQLGPTLGLLSYSACVLVG